MDLAWFFAHPEIIGTLGSTILGIIIWGIRQEGKILAAEKRAELSDERIKALEARTSHVESQVDNIESGLTKELNEVKQSLARIEGYLKARCDSGDCMPGKF